MSKYSPKLCTELTKLMAAGFSDVEVMAKWEISRDTFYRWKREIPEFKEAHEIGTNLFDSNHEKLGKEGMMKTKDIDYQFWRDLGKYRHGWAEKTPSNTNNTQINIDKINILQQQTDSELIEFIKSNLEQVPELSYIIDQNGN